MQYFRPRYHRPRDFSQHNTNRRRHTEEKHTEKDFLLHYHGLCICNHCHYPSLFYDIDIGPMADKYKQMYFHAYDHPQYMNWVDISETYGSASVLTPLFRSSIKSQKCRPARQWISLY